MQQALASPVVPPAGAVVPAGRRLAPLTLLLAVAATAAWAVILLGGGAVGGSSAWTWGGLLLAFALAEGTQLHVELRRQAVSLSLSELPLVLALFLVDPVVLLATRLGAGLLVAVVRRARPYKSAFNLALFSGEGALAVLLFSAVSGGAEQGPRAWLAAYAATVAVSTVTGLLLLAAMAVLQGRMQRADAVVWLGPLVTGALLSTSAALLALLVVGADPRALPVLLLLLVLLVGGYRAYGTLLRRHRVLEQLQTFTAVMGAGGSRDELLAQALSHARTLLSADCAEILVRSSTDGRLRAVRQCADQQPPARLVQDDAVVAALLAGAGPRLVPRGTSDAHEQAWLDALGMRDALAVPVTGSTGVVGVLVVGQRLGDLGSFTQADVGLLEMVATHLEIALRSTDLVERLRHEATHDALTGLPNRTLFAERVAAAIDDRRPGGEFAVLLMDLDGFKDVNDTLGHESGDLVLVQVARRLEAAVADDVTVARLGGDEFCMLVPLGPGRDDVAAVVERMHDGLRLPCPVGGVELEVRASVGAALCPQHGDDGSVLLRHADVAMYAGKAAHLPLQVYGPDIDRSNPRRLALVNELRAAVEDRLLACHYQPKVRVADGTVTGVEALVRWQHPVLGNVPPDDFIPIAEHTGVIVALTSLVLRTALEQSAAWSALGHDLDVAVNVSPRALLSPSFLDEVATLLRDTRVPARRLTLEVTESSVMTEPARAIGVLHSLHALGVQLSVDDFGTGYSSLAYLQRLPVHEVKIDKSFVRDLAVAAGDSAIVRAIVDLGHSLGLRVVAEGVEDARSLAVLREMGCDTAQGYLVSRPLPPDRLLTWLDASAGSPVVPPPRERVLS